MKEVPAKKSALLSRGVELIEKTMSGYPVMRAITSAHRDGKEDPWYALIDRLWEANPSSNLMPLDLVRFLILSRKYGLMS